MAVEYTWDVFSTVDGYGSFDPETGGVDWGGYWSQQGPELLEWRARLFATPQRMIYGATTFREVAGIVQEDVDPLNDDDDWNVSLRRMPATVMSATLDDTLGWEGATIESGDAVEAVRRLKETSELPLRSQASLSLDWSMLEAGLVDRIEVTVFPKITGRTGTSPIWEGLADDDLDLLDSRTFDGRSVALTYRPALHAPS